MVHQKSFITDVLIHKLYFEQKVLVLFINRGFSCYNKQGVHSRI